MDDINAFFSFHFEITLPLGLWPFLHVFLSLLYMITKSVLCLHNCTMHISTGLLLVHIVVALEAKQGVPLLVVLSARLLFEKILPVGELNPGLPRDRRGYLPLYYRGFTRKELEILVFEFPALSSLSEFVVMNHDDVMKLRDATTAG